MNLLLHLRAELPGLMRRREKVALRAVRDAIGAIENAEIGYLAAEAPLADPSESIAGAVAFGHAERVVRPLDDGEMLRLATAQVSGRLDEAARLREHGRIDEALMLKAEAIALQDRIDAWATRN
jgi:uncharacterized protein YqeY